VSTPVWADDRGDPWVEVEPGRVTWISAAMRERIRDKVGSAALEDVRQRYGLRRLVPEGLPENDPETDAEMIRQFHGEEGSSHGPG
jgi:hypothetical protein